jgi:hypothetical protein
MYIEAYCNIQAKAAGKFRNTPEGMALNSNMLHGLIYKRMLRYI